MVYLLSEHTILRGDAMSLTASKLQSETIVGPSKFFCFDFLKTGGATALVNQLFKL